MSADLSRLASALADRYRIEREFGAGGMEPLGSPDGRTAGTR